MKKILISLSAAALAVIAFRNPLVAIVLIVLLGATTLRPLGGLCDATLILPILTGKVMEAFRVEVPELSYFSTDFGQTGGDFAQPVKWKQTVISQLAQVPNAVDYSPGDDLEAGAQSAKDLVVDVKVTIDKAKVVKVKVPAADAATLLINPAFMQSLVEAGKTLGRAVVVDALSQVIPGNFSHSMVLPAAAVDIDSLKKPRIQLNKQYAKTPRYIIGNSDWVGNLADDNRVLLSTGYNQRVTADPYARFQNIEGFTDIREFPELQNTNNLGAFAFEKRAIHVAVRQLIDSVELAQQLGIPVPILRRTETDPETGLSFTVLMFIEKNLDVYAAFIVAYGVKAGRSVNDAGVADPSTFAADSAMDRCGLRLVEA